jgi:ATP-dependent Lon protease
VVIVHKTSVNQNGPIINIDGRILSEGPEISYIREIFTSVLAWETDNPNQYQVSILITDDSSGPIAGKSNGTALYLALLSALYKKPLPNDLASTGFLEVNKNKVSEIGGLKAKTKAAFNKGVKKLVLPQLNSLPNWAEGDIYISPESYQQQVPPEIKEKMTVY